ncbi:type IV toxin-antitoxin system AbiEi family antitoxin domain-containing protein [Dactylosporangium sp. NPDC005572]|uniref:type IV toxin-antitoxin system AbiEi family antitoxin domain-containing protein n=1 Tax=Dactylosporangium sp. NPDC005572 TaxID=3156889 RepID=UPI0033A1EFCC
MLDELLHHQAGVISRGQALAAGLTDGAIEAHLSAGRWLRMLRGIYRTFTGEVPRAAQLWAVLLRAGDRAVLSHHTAAELHGLTDQPDRLIHVTVPADRRITPIPGVVVHISARAAEATHPGPLLRRTRIEDTVLDLSELARSLDAAVGWATAACGRRLTTPERLLDAMGRRKKLRFRRLLTAVLDDTAVGAVSVLERRYLRDVERDHHLPRGRRQHRRPTERLYHDVEYPGYATAVELDGRAWHPEERRRADQRRDNAAAAAGRRTLRYGWLDLARPCGTAVQVGRALRAGGWRGHPQRCRRQSCAVRRRARRPP